MPSSTGTILYGQVTVTNGSAIVTGLNTAFTQQLTAGVSYLTFGSDSTKKLYLVSSIQTDTSLTLNTSYVPTTPTTGTVTSARYQTVISGTFTTTSGSNSITVTAAQSANLTAGQWLVFYISGATTGTAYQLTTVASTQLTLATNVAAADAGTATGVVLSYTNLALHEYAIALALRPIATPDEARNVVDVSYIDLQGIPLRVMVSYVHIYQALFVTVDFGYALGVIRPDFGVIINC
ncbi:MAG: hypothetical protein ACLP9L_25480 [Thermoguttaceae bacterium]